MLRFCKAQIMPNALYHKPWTACRWKMSLNLYILYFTYSITWI